MARSRNHDLFCLEKRERRYELTSNQGKFSEVLTDSSGEMHVFGRKVLHSGVHIRLVIFDRFLIPLKARTMFHSIVITVSYLVRVCICDDTGLRLIGHIC